MAIYYHGTTEHNAREIELGVFLGSIDTEENMDLTSGETCEDGVVFLADNPEYAAGYGNVVFVVETDDAIFWRECPVTGEREYYAPAVLLNENGAWWRME